MQCRGASPSRPGGALHGATSAKGPESDPPWGLFTPGCQRHQGGLREPCGLRSRQTPSRSPVSSRCPQPRGSPQTQSPRAAKQGTKSQGPVHNRSSAGSARSQDMPGAARAGTGCADDP